MSEQNPEIKATTEVEEVDLTKDEQPEKPPTPLERILQSLRKAQPASNPPASGGRRDLGKDKSKSLYVLVAAGIAVILFLLMYLSSPQKPNQGQAPSHRGKPDLGQRTTPGQAQKQAGSAVPLLNADTSDQQPERGGEVTPEDINRMSHANSQSVIAKPNFTANTLVPPEEATGKTSGAKNPTSQQYVLGRIDFSDPELRQRYANAGQGPELSAVTVPPRSLASSNSESDLKKPSLVFVSSESTTIPNAAGSLRRSRQRGCKYRCGFGGNIPGFSAARRDAPGGAARIPGEHRGRGSGHCRDRIQLRAGRGDHRAGGIKSPGEA